LAAGPILWSALGAVTAAPAPATAAEAPVPAPSPIPSAPAGRALRGARGNGDETLLPPAASILEDRIVPIDLNTTLKLAGVQNPDVLVAQSRVVESAALRQLAAVQLLPTINFGTNYDTHTGVLQQSNGNILSVNRSALYVGSGTNAVAAGTVNIPGVFLTGNPAIAIYGYLSSLQVVQEREFATWAIRNQAFLAAALAYSELLRGEGTRAIAMQVRDETRIVARLTSAYAQEGRGRKADADRAATELARREADFQAAEGDVLTASARLAQVINVDPSIRLHPTDAWVVPHPLVPDPMPVAELIALALIRRPELGERRAVIRQALLALDNAKVLPFSPNFLLGFSAGGFGGGSNLVRPVFGGFGGRTDADAVFWWSAQNLGIGNVALINIARSRVGVAQYQEVAMLDRIRAEVAEAYARTHARFAQIATLEEAVRTGTNGFREDLNRIEGAVGLPIEVLDNLRLLARARQEYLGAIVDYNQAQFQLFVALGQPPADALAHPVPTAGVVPRGQPMPSPPPRERNPG
jgi:outer membrane protein TolC